MVRRFTGALCCALFLLFSVQHQAIASSAPRSFASVQVRPAVAQAKGAPLKSLAGIAQRERRIAGAQRSFRAYRRGQWVTTAMAALTVPVGTLLTLFHGYAAGVSVAKGQPGVAVLMYGASAFWAVATGRAVQDLDVSGTAFAKLKKQSSRLHQRSAQAESARAQLLAARQP